MNYNYYYNSFEEFLASINNPSPKDARRSETIGERVAFFGSRDYATALNLAKNGDVNTAQKVREMYDKIKAGGVIVPKEDFIFSDEGILFDTATFIEGNPEYWLETVKVENKQHKGVIKLYVNIATSFKMVESEYFLRGAYSLMLIEALEKAGHSVELIAVLYMSDGSQKNYIESQINLKQADQAVDLSKLAFVLSHVAFFRRLMFHWLELLPQDLRIKFSITEDGFYGKVATQNFNDGISLGWDSFRLSTNDLLRTLKPYGEFEII